MESKISFRAITPLDDATLLDHVSRAVRLRLPEVQEAIYPYPGVLRLIANGPSALRAPLDGPTLAVNGALRLFTQRDIAPTYWAACDPQELVADFLEDAPEATHYLIASKCHPKVFERLMKLGRKISVWHVAEEATFDLLMGAHPVTSSSSVTLTVFEVMERLGWRAFETWGWDGCFMDGRHHAADQMSNAEVITLDVAGREFDTTGSWVLEAQDACHRLTDYPRPLDIRGGGMIGAVLQHAWRANVREALIKRVLETI